MSAFEAVASALKSGHQMLSHEDAESFEVGGVFIKVMDLKKGQQVVTHAHPYTHAHILGKGKILLEVDGRRSVYTAPAVLEIVAGEHHGITALEDSTGFCVHDLKQTGIPFEGN